MKRLKKYAADRGDSESTVRRDAKAGRVELIIIDGRTYAREALNPPASSKPRRQSPRGDTAPKNRWGRPPKTEDAITLHSVLGDAAGPQYPFKTKEPRS